MSVTRLNGSLLLMLAVTACAAPRNGDPAAVVVALIDGSPQSLADLEFYLESNKVDADGGPGSGRATDEVNSRLFDGFIDERLLLAEAQRRKLQVGEREIDASLGLGGEETELALQNTGWQEARRRLMIQKLLEQVMLEQSTVTDEEVRAQIAENPENGATGRRVRIRNLMLSSAEEAERVYQEIRRHRLTFDEAAARLEVEAGPGQRVPVELGWENLSEELRAALDGLKRGQVSKPVAQYGAYYLFRIEEWVSDSLLEEELLRTVRSGLEERNRQRAQKRLIQELRKTTKIRVKLRNLPFDYVPDGSG